MYSDNRSPKTRYLIVNADDFAFSKSISEGILEAHHQGIVTSTTLLANMPAATSSIAGLRSSPELGVGIHLNACQGPPLSQAGKRHLATKEGIMNLSAPKAIWASLLNKKTRDAISAEFEAQIQWTLDHGIVPTHLDSHRHLHAWPAISRRVIALAEKYRIPALRRVCEHWPQGNRPSAPGSNRHIRIMLNLLDAMANTRFRSATATTGTWGIEHTGTIDADWLLEAIRLLPMGLTEIMVHPGNVDGTPPTQTRLWQSRVVEKEALCDPRVRQALSENRIELKNYGRL